MQDFSFSSSSSVLLSACYTGKLQSLLLSLSLSFYPFLPLFFPQLHSYFAGVRLNYTSADRNSSEKSIFDFGFSGGCVDSASASASASAAASACA